LKGISVTTNNDVSWIILVVEDIEETRDGIEKLLKAEGYRVQPARTVEDAILRAKLQPPDLLLVSLAGPTEGIIRAAKQIRQEAGLLEHLVPIVIFSIKEVGEGEEVAIEGNVYLTQPANFDQLRALLRRLLKNTRPNPN
jgi:DNA-binding response OmpR family regulator